MAKKVVIEGVKAGGQAFADGVGSPAFIQELEQAVGSEVELVVAAGGDAVRAALADADGCCVNLPLDEVLAEAPKLSWAQVGSAGVDSYPVALMAEAGVTLTNASVIYGIQLADHVMALVLASVPAHPHPPRLPHPNHGLWARFSRQLPFLLDAQREERWASRSEFPAGELAGQTMLVVGLGGAGLETARRASAFGMNVVATRRDTSAPKPDFVDAVHGSDRETLRGLLPEADWIAVCCGT